MIDRAIDFAMRMHLGQKRKYSGIPYITHPLAVMEIVSTVEHTETMLVAAVLHDVVEDCDIEIKDIVYFFNDDVAKLVEQLTDVSKAGDGNRKARKEIDAIHLTHASKEAKTIKLADLIHNSESIIRCDPCFAKVYMKEKELLLVALRGGDPELMEQARAIIANYKLDRGYDNATMVHRQDDQR